MSLFYICASEYPFVCLLGGNVVLSMTVYMRFTCGDMIFYQFCVYYLCWLCLCLLECSQLHSLCYLVYFYVIIYCQNAVGYLSGGGNVVLSMTV